MTVRELKRDPIYDEEIVLKGKITKKLDDDEYRFEDSTGRMTIIIPSKLFTFKKISEDDTVEVTGVMKDKGRRDTFTATKLKKK
jgi:uncharacterized protein (TIGR00156 family)